MRKIETTVYKFAELSDKAQEKALTSLYDVNIYDSWYECTLDEFAEILNTIGLDTRLKDIQFRGFSGQGDGLSFTGHYTYAKNSVQKIIAEFPTWTSLHADIKALQKIQRRNFYRISGDIYRIGYHYCHENTVKFSQSDFSGDIESEVTDILRSIMSEFYNSLSRQYYFLTSKESIIETINCNEYEFDIDGNLI